MCVCVSVYVSACTCVCSCRIAANFDGTGSITLTKRDYFTINLMQIWLGMLLFHTLQAHEYMQLGYHGAA